MSFAEIQANASKLSRAERHRLTAYLIALDDQEDQAYRQKMAGKIDDKNPANWVDSEELDSRLGLND